MRVVLQRVTHAEVRINNKINGRIKNGLLIFLGIEDGDNEEDIKWLCGKIAHLRIFNDKNGVMNLSVKEVDGDILLISQFTLHASTKKGNRPSYIKASKPEFAIPMYNKFITQLENEMKKKIETGEFGAMMDISLVNNGPVTIIIDTKIKE
jgi:D-aminoacyl-tRNA deacylase